MISALTFLLDWLKFCQLDEQADLDVTLGTELG